ncbi:MAG: hypothetical protein WCV99_16050, partial [Sterolibacterium sp.]
MTKFKRLIKALFACVVFALAASQSHAQTAGGACSPEGTVQSGFTCSGGVWVTAPACTGGQYWDTAMAMCTCGPNMTWNGSSCVTPTPTCTGGQFWDGSMCTCGAGMTWNGSSCVTSTPTCTGGQYWDTAMAMCTCGPNMTWNGSSCVA